MTCPYCGNQTPGYTDPQHQVRCHVCFNHLQATPGTPIGQMHDLDAPMVIVGATRTYTYPDAITQRDQRHA